MPKKKKTTSANSLMTINGFVDRNSKLATTLSAHVGAFKIYAKKNNLSGMKTFEEWEKILDSYLKS